MVATGAARKNVKRFRGGLVVKAHRLLYHSTLGARVEGVALALRVCLRGYHHGRHRYCPADTQVYEP